MTGVRTRAEACVVGGGPAGAATAWALARNGLDVLLVDRATFPRPKPCAEYLSPQAARLLDELGVLATLEQSGAPTLAGMRIVAGDAAFEGRFAAAHGFRGYRDRGLAVRRERLDALLLDAARAAGARVMEGTAVRDVVRAADGRVTGVALSGGGVVDAMHVVGADGLGSVVARRLGLARRRRWPRRIAFVTHFADVRGLADVGEMHVFDDGYCGIARVDDGVANVAVVIPARLAARAAGNQEPFVRDWLHARPALRGRFADATPVSPVRVTGPFASHARAACAPGATLVGDAADFLDPFTGEGIYAALRGAELLAPYVVDAVAARRDGQGARERAALDAYDRCRRSEFAGKWRVERLVAVAVASPPLMALAARRLADRRDLADLLVGVTGDFVPPRQVLNLGFALQLLGVAPEAA